MAVSRPKLVLISGAILVGLAIVCGGGSAVFCPPAQAQAASSKPQSRHRKPGKTTRRRRSSPRLRRMHQAFVASTTLKPMARQLLQDRTPAAYAGVEAYARRHASSDAGALAWLVVGYAHTLDSDFAKAIDPLNRAKPHAGDLGDYVNYYLANAYFQTGRAAESLAVLNDFEKNYPDSLLLRDARVLYANALLADNQARQAASLLEKNREPTRADVELALGKAYERMGAADKAITTLRNLYYTMPLSGEADQAKIELQKLPAAPPGISERRTRADLLLKGRRYSDAANEYRDLVGEVSADEKPIVQLALGVALHRSGQDREAKRVLESMDNPPGGINAERLFNLAEIARDGDDEDTFFKLAGQLRQMAPTSPWLEQALLLGGNIYLLKRDYDHAIDYYRELAERFPNSGRAAYAHWKVAWLSLRQGRKAEAEKAFEDQIALYPSSAEVPAALYWRARLAEEDGEAAKARAFYQKISDRFRNYYYGDLARRRLAKLEVAGEAEHYALLDRIPPIGEDAHVVADPAPSDNLRVQKAELLENGALVDFAIQELEAAADEDKGNWITDETAKLYQDAGRYDMALRTLKRAAPNYFAVDFSSLPRSYWEFLFPRPYWEDLRRFSSANALDPYLVASLIRQESEFNPNAVSRKNAVGLMQLLPKVGRGMAHQVKLRHFASSQLFTPAVNLQLGTRYFRMLVDKFGSFEYALAAYNAGSDRVQDWLNQGPYRDPQEFVESIPFTETREYVQAILRNAQVYRQLYGAP